MYHQFSGIFTGALSISITGNRPKPGPLCDAICGWVEMFEAATLRSLRSPQTDE
jgi:hypothetical protein